ncbi:MAG: SPASM domain-containing protein [Spirochaetes bacterium]|jgi:MoaA/NifB/PqqE/SkfB family radical SAM enzyme|nr:SPASM domain-containing protein [Spirochaetota bacterium]
MPGRSEKKFFSWLFRKETPFVSDEIRQLYIELSSKCNLSCKTCARNSIVGLKPSDFSLDKMKRLLPMIEGLPFLERIVILGFGEPLCNPRAGELLKLLKGTGKKILLVTNASFLEEKISRLIINLELDSVFVSWDDDISGGGKAVRRGSSASAFKSNLEQLIRMKKASGRPFPEIGIEVVATRSNYNHIKDIISYGRWAGIDRFIVTNIFTYTRDMKDEILYTVFDRPEIDLKKMLKKEISENSLTVASQKADTDRNCPFIERGTVFITSGGDISPCPELAHTHNAFYFGLSRTHLKRHYGNIKKETLAEIWKKEDFRTFRNSFLYFDYPDCSTCADPERCHHRTVDIKDCYYNLTPCGECLWAKGIVLCP